MTDVMKAIVKLPPKSRQSIALKNNNNNYENYSPPLRQPKEPLRYDYYLVSDRLYMQVPSSIMEYDIMSLLQTCQPQDIHLTSQPFPELSSGYITFPTKDHADLAFTLFSGANFSNGMRLLLYMSPLTSECNSDPAADILQVQNLPTDSTNKSLYDLFRPFGPMALCKVVVEQGAVDYHGAALIQYYHTDDADHAVSFMNNRQIQENIITVFPFVSSKRQRSNVEMDVQHGNQSNKQVNPVDYTNLYIKNLDLNAKSSDLFKHFRKFGHIISARVMKNARTNQSKGFGFVSFINAEEANRALHGMNGRYILSKTVQVAFHEPKKTRNEKSSVGGGDMTTQQDINDDDDSLMTPSNTTTDTNKSNHNTQLSHMAASYSPPTPQTNYSLQSPVPQQHHHRQHQHQHQQHQQSTSQYNHHPSATSYQQQSNQPPYLPQQYSMSDDSVNYKSSLGSIKKSYQTSTSKIDSTSNHHINGYHSPQTNDYNGNIYPMATNIKKGTTYPADYDHSYSNYSTSRKQQQLLNNTSTTPPSLSLLASGACIQPAPSRHYPTIVRSGTRPSMRRRGSIESISSVMTETSTNAQRQRLTNAVHQCEETNLLADQVEDIVDMLLTLKKKERSLCLFNPDFLKFKVQQAKTALEIFDDGDNDNDDDDNDNDNDDDKDIDTERTVAPESSTTTKEGTNKSNNDNSDDTEKRSPPTTEDVDAFLTSLEGMAMHEKKQKLGDWLFPLVKATGIKHAPKITIRLLDTVPLHELAHLMHVESSLRLRIDQILTGESNSS